MPQRFKSVWTRYFPTTDNEGANSSAILKDKSHGHDIFEYLVQSNNKILQTVSDSINFTFKECHVGPQMSGKRTTTSVSKKYADISRLDLRIWPDFDETAVDFIAKVPDLELFKYLSLAEEDYISNESQVQAEYQRKPAKVVSECCRSLSGHKDYAYFGTDCGFLSQSGSSVFGDPDLVLVSDRAKHLPKLTVELKTLWAIRSLDNLISIYEQECGDFETKKRKSDDAVKKIEKGKIQRAVEQIYVKNFD
ncbi:hypothetical protein MIR68_005226 [Amoeboaphelidium protococcarum]|nr:hypothetical protein MIR68_005226 [Amoeboaphelidium protococcarum]